MKQRVERIAHIVRQQTGPILVNLIPKIQLTITSVDVSPDLRHATVWLSAWQDKAVDEAVIMKHVKSKQTQLQQAVAIYLKTKFVPRLIFRYDTGSKHADSIEQLLKKL